MGSERQVDFGELKIKFLISAVVTCSNEEKIGAGFRKGKWIKIN